LRHKRREESKGRPFLQSDKTTKVFHHRAGTVLYLRDAERVPRNALGSWN